MNLPRQKFRELVFLAVYTLDMGKADTPQEEEIVKLLMDELKVTKKQGHEAYRHAEVIYKAKEKLDALITQASHAYDFERIPSVERNILRLGLYELFEEKLVPPKVAIAEAIRLSRKFSSPESSSYVNAILDNLLKRHGGGEQTP